ncbi:SDR family oxidoreductase [Aureimonas leprariae]|uniref:SDR family oxidoreductase n=1 Tax=Plantimonas leprariae TaxID=2615207 RepID=A0A7V7PL87_9HYPH|nr:SDR family oxidoreductase [Aureimonas leprariae]KAB0677057.1 SDR family oxidoreductase [Aureimonas leprariae]
MRIFLTGATGFIGSRVVPELIAAGHQVLGLTRSDRGAEALRAAGAEPFRGTLEEPDGLRRGAAEADAVIHTAFDHDFANFVANCAKDGRVIRALGEALKGSDRPLLITSGVGLGGSGHGRLASEDIFDTDHPNPRIASELAGNELLEAGVNVSVMRLSQIHDPVKQGLVTPYVALCREKGAAPFVGEGANRWSAAHVGDAAKLYRLAIEAGRPGARYNAVAEEGVPIRTIAETVARGLGVEAVSVLPDETADYFGWMAGFAGMDMAASSALTRERLGWQPTGPGLVADLEAMDYSAGN